MADERRWTEVLHLETGTRVLYQAPPAEAVLLAWRQARGDWNTWQDGDTPPLVWGRWTVSCGSWTALVGRTPCLKP